MMTDVEPFRRVTFSELSRREKGRLCWGIVWRACVANICAVVIGMLVAGVIGAVVGITMVIMSKLGRELSLEDFRLVGRGLGIVIAVTTAIGCQIVLFRWLLQSTFGDLRVTIVRVGGAER